MWESGINQAEAQQVASILYDLVKSGKESIGVVTFNAKQQDLILDTVERTMAEKSLNIPSEVFVKNIENVQGDEREIIIFSVGYAPDKKGKVNTQFGSLSMEGGENRLNVAITRAKQKVIVVTSIFPNQLKVDDSKNEGPKLFKEYLNYAHSVSKGEFIPSLNTQSGFAQHWYLKKQLEKHPFIKENEYAAISDFPFSDLLLRKNHAYSDLISTDDDLYFNAWSIKASHGTDKQHFKKKGWNNHRFYSRNYWKNKQKVEEQLLKIIGEK